jgi:hypothetical protein
LKSLYQSQNFYSLNNFVNNADLLLSYDEVCKKLISFLDLSSKFYQNINEEETEYFDTIDAAVSCLKVYKL